MERRAMSEQSLVLKYFVLKPAGTSVHALASRRALLVYADIIERENHTLAQEIRDWVRKEHEKL
jgi:hypothetical protein